MAANGWRMMPSHAEGRHGQGLLQQSIVKANGAQSVLASALGSDWKGKLSPVAYLSAIPLAFVSPWTSCALYAGVALIRLVPDRRIERKLVDAR